MKSDQTKIRVGSQNRQMGRSSGSQEGGSLAVRSSQGRSTSRGSVTSSNMTNHTSSRLSPQTSTNVKVGNSKYGNKKSIIASHSPLSLRNGQKNFGAKFLKQMIFKCNYYFLEKLPDLHVKQALVTVDAIEKTLRKVTIILPAVVSVYLPEYDKHQQKRHFTDYPTGLLKDDEITEVATVSVAPRKASFSCDYSCGNDSISSFSFMNGLRGVLKDTTRNFPDPARLIKNVAFRSPIESAREASFDESMSTLIDGSSAESRELSFLACQLENANLMHDVRDSQQSVHSGIRRNATQLKRQHYRVLKTLRNLAMQKCEPNSRLCNNRSQSVGDLSTFSSADSGYGSNNGETVDENDYMNCDRPFVPKIFDPTYENLSDNSTILSNFSVEGQSCSTSRRPVNFAPAIEKAKCVARFMNPALNRELTRKHNEMNWRRRQIIQKKESSVVPSCKGLTSTGQGNLGLTIVGLSHKDNILSSLSQRSLSSLLILKRRSQMKVKVSDRAMVLT